MTSIFGLRLHLHLCLFLHLPEHFNHATPSTIEVLSQAFKVLMEGLSHADLLAPTLPHMFQVDNFFTERLELGKVGYGLMFEIRIRPKRQDVAQDGYGRALRGTMVDTSTHASDILVCTRHFSDRLGVKVLAPREETTLYSRGTQEVVRTTCQLCYDTHLLKRRHIELPQQKTTVEIFR